MIFDKLSEKDQKTLKVGGLLIVMIVVCGSLNILVKEYSKTSKELKTAKAKFNSVKPKSDGSLNPLQARYYKKVPVYKLPQEEKIPGETFRLEFLKLLRDCKINFTVLNHLPMSSKKNAAGFRTRNIHCKGKCSFQQAVDLLAKLYETPRFVGIEDFKIECNPKNRSQMELAITVSTFIK